MASYETYRGWDLIFPLVGFFFILFISAIVVIVFTIIKWRVLNNLNDNDIVPQVFLEIIKEFFPAIEKKTDTEHKNTVNMEIDGIKMKKLPFAILTCIIVPCISATSFVTFMNGYLIEADIGECVPNFDCFQIDDSSDVLQSEPVRSCLHAQLQSIFNTTPLEIMDNITADVDIDSVLNARYECYRFVYSYVDGIGAMGGLLVFATLLSTLYFGLLICTRNIFDDNDCCRRGFYCVIIGVGAACCFLFFIVNTAAPDVRDAVFKTKSDALEFVAYLLTFLAIVVSGGFVAYGIED